ncbi:hypothetical protein E3N88_23674 [Mikania micrantha]|uniref:Putative zinc-finger domain-containing protein n=1 Tax=Mikania micrantha TaxID=192012 RepID=A0A5N6NFP0_9ASTR|nr:hypothetical protein E3N88_23674 [Mikania micrantha]
MWLIECSCFRCEPLNLVVDRIWIGTVFLIAERFHGGNFLDGFLREGIQSQRLRLELELVEVEMPGLMSCRLEFDPSQPFKAASITGSLHMTIQTGVLVETLTVLGAEVRWCSCNIFSTQDHAAAAIARDSATVCTWKGETLDNVEFQIVDDGGVKADEEFEKTGKLPDGSTDNAEFQIVLSIIKEGLQIDPKKYHKMKERLVVGVSEETTTGVKRLYQMQANGTLLFPAINVNDYESDLRMEETISSPPTTSDHVGNAKIITKFTEEADLSASENDANTLSFFQDIAASQNPNATILSAVPLNKGTRVVDKEMVINNPKSERSKKKEKNWVSALTPNPAVPLRTTGNSNKRKGVEKNRVPFVISFSDDDSGSDSEEYKNGSTMESDEMTCAVKNRILSNSLVNSQSHMVKQTTKTNSKSPKKLSTSRTFVSSVNRVNGARFKNGGSTLVGVKAHPKKANSPSIINFGQNVHVNSNKLQDLRQLIAIRENEIKSKAGKLDKEIASSSIKNSSEANLKSIAAKSKNFTECAVVEPKEQEKKRLKDGTVQYNAAADKGSSGIMKNSLQHNRITTLGESSAQLMAKSDKTSPIQGSLMNSSFWNHFGATTGEMDIKSLLELEELQDKELDEAQDHRRKCEIEERNALKAYRRAQRALAEANTRCSYLYHKRNLFSANLRSHVMDESNMFWSNMPHQHTEANVNCITNMSENDTPHHQVQNECGDPDTSGSEPQEEEKTNDVGSSLHENNSNNILAEDEQTSAFELKAGDSSLDSHLEGICSERNNKITNNSLTINTNEDSLILEATLRSQLFARLGNRISKKNESGQSMEIDTVEREDGEIIEDSGTKPSSGTEKDQIYDFGDTVMLEKSISEQLVNIKDQCDVEKYPVNYDSFLVESILKSAFDHVKFAAMVSSMKSHTDDIVSGKNVVNGVCGVQPTNSDSNSLLDLYVNEDGSYSNNLPINPFWPHCMFELRGKCNDDECPWQHVRDYSSKNIESNSNDHGSLCLAPPTYLVCLDSLKADSHPYKYLVAQTIEQRWQKCFSASLVVSSSILADLNSDELCLHGPETRIEVHGVWNRQSSYFHGQNAREGLRDEQMDGIYQRLEMAFLNLSKEVSKQKGHRESLIVLARALEEHPTSVLLWIVYLHIYYSNQKSIGKDDLFRYAIEHCDSSYELWLMFINSREKLDDRLVGYNTAISVLCCHASTSNCDPEFDSDCILDLFLQMINCLCSSGQVNIAIQIVYGLLSSTNRSNNLHAQSLPDIQEPLTIPDRCVLWICSIHLLMYKKLPDTVIQQFECRKELPVIDWHFVHLTDDEKHQAVTLIERAPEYIDSRSYQSKRSAISTQHFALNHIRCAAVLKGFDSCKNLLKKYIQLYPSCLELVLLSIRVNGYDSAESTFAAFEKALSSWVDEHGLQCIWNQYAEYALESGKFDFAKDIMERWFHSISGIYKSKTGILNMSAWISSLTQTDIVFGLLNLSLLKQLQNEHTEARIAIEQAFEVASSDDYNHCVKEHAIFLLKKEFCFEKACLNSFFNMMNRYLMDSRARPSPEPLSRRFIKQIGKPKMQKFVNSLLCPVSSDSNLLNRALESCFGPSLLPFQASERQADVINLAESVMEMRPANYRLALCICKNQASANASISFWASVQLISSLFQAVPVAPESVWVDAAGLLKNVAGFRPILESFHKRVLSVYPFSLRLWKSYRELYDDDDDKSNAVTEMAGEKGLKL